MLIDYHLHNHFSPDSQEKTEKIVERAIEMEMRNICITNHVENHDKTGAAFFDFDEAVGRFRRIQEEIADVQQKFPSLPIRFGAELEYVEGHMEELNRFVNQTDFDFLVGSVHIVHDVVISSHLFVDQLYSKADEEKAYGGYFENLMKLVEWGNFSVVGHFDINKKYGYRYYGAFQPEKYKDRILPILHRMKEKNIGLELNTKCLHSKCKEIFPHPQILRWAVEAGIENFTLASDAHKAEHVSEFISEALEIAKDAGIRNISTYAKRQPTLNPIN